MRLDVLLYYILMWRCNSMVFQLADVVSIAWEELKRWNKINKTEQRRLLISSTLLTINTDFDPLRNTWRNAIRSNTQIRPHIQSRHPCHLQCLTLPIDNWKGDSFVISTSEATIHHTFGIWHSPAWVLLIDIFVLSSLFHLIDGIGLPVARHFNVTFDPSRTITSLDVIASSIFGGTVMSLEILLII